jgi:putative membrane protein
LKNNRRENGKGKGNIHPVDAERAAVDYMVLGVKGFCMGIADIIPGISGGTIAFILEIYEDLIKAIKSFDGEFLKLLARGKIRQAFSRVAWRFLGSVIVGIGCAIALLAKLVSWLLREHPVFINAFFFGLILATVPIIAGAMKKWDVKKAGALAVSAAGTFFFVQLTPVSTPESWWFVFASGALAICAMILPGISGAFILLLMGKYQFILEAIHSRDIMTMLIFMAGMAAGILSFVRVLEWLFRKFHDLTIAVLAGFVIGSLNKIWPWKRILETMITSSGKIVPIKEVNILPEAFDLQVLLALLLALTGCAVAFLLHSVPQRHGKARPDQVR